MFKSVVAIVPVFLISTCTLYAQERANRTVTVTCTPLTAPNFDICNAGEMLTVENGCAGNIQIACDGGVFQPPTAPGASVVCPCTNGCDYYRVSNPAIETGPGALASGRENTAACPAVSDIGFLVLVIGTVLGGACLFRTNMKEFAR